MTPTRPSAPRAAPSRRDGDDGRPCSGCCGARPDRARAPPELGHTQEEIADLCGVHRVSIAKLERGGGAKFPIVLRVVHMLGMDIEVRRRG
jgi:DNA-binding XRE family transcriptional regulator